MNTPPSNLKTFESIVQVMKTLRSPTGCPWDQEQTHKSIASCALEEVCELIDAIETENEENLIEELGDVLLQVVFHAEMARQEERFDIYDVIEKLNQKLISRHPHVFSDKDVKNTEEALKNWTDMKAKEKKTTPETEGFGVPLHLPALQRADKIGKKTKKLKFDWEKAADVMTSVESEVQEFKEALESGKIENMQDEFGDVLFTLVQVARHLGIDSEQALRGTNQKVENRWIGMKKIAKSQGLKFEDLPTEKLEELWKEVKKLER
jgi:tetrapyrrole methylase family protein/MazG family protein